MQCMIVKKMTLLQYSSVLAGSMKETISGTAVKNWKDLLFYYHNKQCMHLDFILQKTVY